MERIKRMLSNKRGQNTVEYLLMLTVLVGVVLLVGVAMKNFFPTLFTNISALISNAATGLAQG